jgi:hypothetical protein
MIMIWKPLEIEPLTVNRVDQDRSLPENLAVTQSPSILKGTREPDPVRGAGKWSSPRIAEPHRTAPRLPPNSTSSHEKIS